LLFDGYITYAYPCCLHNALRLLSGRHIRVRIGDTEYNSAVSDHFSKNCPTRFDLDVKSVGTNGGISLLGTLASAAGGGLIGLSAIPFILSESCQHSFIPVSTFTLGVGIFGGFFGSLVDSVLGATIQESRVDEKSGVVLSEHSEGGAKGKLVSGISVLNNNQVNLVSSCITSASMALIVSFFI
jgi:uncharacterized membrane protein